PSIRLHISSRNSTPPTPPPTLSLHDALPISHREEEQPADRDEVPVEVDQRVEQVSARRNADRDRRRPLRALEPSNDPHHAHPRGDRKSTRLNSSHVSISYAVFCLKKKKK